MTRINQDQFDQTPAALAQAYHSDLETGLQNAQYEQHIAKYGKNMLVEAQSPSLVKRIATHLNDVTSLILLFAVLLSVYLAFTADSGWAKPIVIGSILVLNVSISLFQEGKAEKALASLRELNTQTITVIREGSRQTVPAESLVPGDVIILEAGDTVPADARLINASDLSVDEAMLTGESEAVDKDEDAPELFSGTAVLSGKAQAIVVGTGMDTEMGDIADMLNSTEKVTTPLARRLDQLGKRLSVIAVVGGGITILLSVLMYQEPLAESLMLGVGLAIAAVPESLPVIVTLSLTAGVQKMAKQNAIVRRMTAVETIGNVTVIASDKTGTLTQNEMTATHFWPGEGELLTLNEDDLPTQSALAMWTLATAVTEDKEGKLLGSPTEIAIHRFAQKQFDTASVKADYPQIDEDPFDSTKKRMATLHRHEGHYVAVVKGAFDRLHFNPQADAYQQTHDQMATEGLRVLAAGYKTFDHEPDEDWKTSLDELTPLGLIGLMDPPRPEVTEAIDTAQSAGIKTVMITGDHVETASAIARDIGILHAGDVTMTGDELAKLSDEELEEKIGPVRVFARTTPADKLRIVKAWQAQGEVVAMTGDGVNDAPALRQADVGVAMGITGTDVAKGAADIILTDDNFATIINAVQQGRTVYQNIVKAVEFLVSVNFAQIFTMIVAVLFGWGAPLSVEQMLIINILADGIPGFFLSREPAEPGIMNQHPLPSSASIWGQGLGKRVTVRTLTYVALILGVYALGRFGFDGGAVLGVTLLFFVLAIGSVLDLFPIKTRQPLTLNSFTSNPIMGWSVLAIIAALVLFGSIPTLSATLGLTALNGRDWLVIAFVSLLPMIIVEVTKRVQHRHELAHWLVSEDE